MTGFGAGNLQYGRNCRVMTSQATDSPSHGCNCGLVTSQTADPLSYGCNCGRMTVRGERQARLTALITALSEAVTMLASSPTPQSTWSPTAHSTYAAAMASPPADSACSW